jgi:hypothetical protein
MSDFSTIRPLLRAEWWQVKGRVCQWARGMAKGAMCSSQLSRRDHVFASGFKALPYDGFANLHALTLDLGEIEANAPLRLLMTGYVNYFSATSLYAAWQAGFKEIPPYVEAQLADGTWQRIPGDAGFPAGPGADDRGGSDWEVAGGHAAHSANDEFANLLGPSVDRSKRGRGARAWARARRRMQRRFC